MNIPRVLNCVYNEAWAITPERHTAIRQALDAYIAGSTFPDVGESETAPTLSIVGNVAVLNVEGTIVPKASGLEAACGMFSLEKFRADLKAAAANPAVKSILLNIGSGGGMITGVPESADLIAQVAKVKNVVAFTGEMAGSAAYWLGSQANRFYMSKSAKVGSIGVYLARIDVTRAMEIAGEKLELFKAGEFKAMGIPGKPLSDVERELLQASVDKIYKQFVSYVQNKRPTVPKSAMQGQVFDAEDAVKYGLVDGQIDDIDALIAYLNSK